MKSWIAILGVSLLTAAVWLPIRTVAHLERDPSNPVQHLVLESRSCLGLKTPPLGVRLSSSCPTWGNAREGFFMAPKHSGELQLRAWPNFARSWALEPSGRELDEGKLLEQGDLEAFRTWFVALLEDQLEGESPAWEKNQRDCAGLLRFAFREAWGPHNLTWKERVGFRGAAVSRDPSPGSGGPWRTSFRCSDAWVPFADGSTLRKYNCLPMGLDPILTRPGDLIFFARGGARPQPDHAMAFGRPDVDGEPTLIYHTGPDGQNPGQLRRVRLGDLLQHPDPEFRPQSNNPAFLGCYRWRVLAGKDAAMEITEKQQPERLNGYENPGGPIQHIPSPISPRLHAFLPA